MAKLHKFTDSEKIMMQFFSFLGKDYFCKIIKNDVT